MLATARGLVAFVAYGWLTREFYFFLDMDSCLDAGGVYDSAVRPCSHARPGEYQYLAAMMPFLGWLLVLGLPALLVFGADRAVFWVVRKVSKTPTDAPPERRAG